MILLDANLLLYAGVSSLPEHERARTWLEAQLSARVRVGVPWVSSLAFLRIACNPRVFERPASVARAWQQVAHWLDSPTAFVPEAGERHRDIIAGWIPAVVTTSKVVPDAHVAALAVEHGLVLCSTDGDFARFPGLRWHNPLDQAAGPLGSRP